MTDAERRCTTTSRPARWPSPTAASTSATRRSSTSRTDAAHRPGVRQASAPARSTRRTRRRSRSRRATCTRTTARARPPPSAPRRREADTENISTTNLTVADKWGNVVGVHAHHRADRRLRHRGARPRLPAQQRADRLLDRLRPGRPEPDRAAASARARRCRRRSCSRTASRSSRSARPAARRSSPPCCRCIFNRIDLRHDASPQAIAAPRASQRNTAKVTAEPAFIDEYGSQLAPYGHTVHAVRGRVHHRPRRSARRPRSSSCPTAAWSQPPSP